MHLTVSCTASRLVSMPTSSPCPSRVPHPLLHFPHTLSHQRLRRDAEQSALPRIRNNTFGVRPILTFSRHLPCPYSFTLSGLSVSMYHLSVTESSSHHALLPARVQVPNSGPFRGWSLPWYSGIFPIGEMSARYRVVVMNRDPTVHRYVLYS